MNENRNRLTQLFRYALLAGIVWTFLIAGSLVWNIQEGKQQTQALVAIAARSHFNKDQAFRYWATRHGGVYVPIDERTPPNPYLEHVPLRDIETSGRSLTLMNPAYMLRQVMEEYEALYGIKGHITSLNPLRPENAPDAWERSALTRFEQGVEEAVEFTEIKGEEYFRLMRPMVTEKGCLKCHGHQGYKEGDIRGGVSVSVPMSTYLALERGVTHSLVGWHGVIWLLGLGALGLVVKRNKRLVLRRLQAEEALRESHAHLEEQVKQRTLDLQEANDGLRTEILERKRLEQELVRTQRLGALSEMAAGFCHNFNNILVSVLGGAQLLKRNTDNPQTLREVEEILTGGNRARDLVQQLSQSVRGEPESALYAVSLNEAVHQAVQTTRSHWKDQSEAQGITIEVATELEDLPSIGGTQSELNDILLNLLFNAVDAMPEGGTITFRTQSVEDQVQLTVTDTGKGMDEETRRKVFEPFFTTKMDIGKGLGLTTVYGIITRWRGSIDVESTPGQGTTFTLRFPMWMEPEVQEEEKIVEVRQGRIGKVLIVDDDEGICALLSRFLGEKHEVDTVADGRKALERFAPGKYDVVLIDMGMPGMSGDQLLKQIKDIDPQVATVLITGLDLPDTDTRVSSFDFQRTKPFGDLDEVEDVVARAIALHDERVKKGN